MIFRYDVVHRMVIDMKNTEIMISRCDNWLVFAIVFNNIQNVFENINEQIINKLIFVEMSETVRKGVRNSWKIDEFFLS